MNAVDLLKEVKSFQSLLIDHRRLFNSSLDRFIPTHPIRNQTDLRAQSETLGRMLGMLKPYLFRFQDSWSLVNPGTGQPWDALHEAVGMRAAAIVKGESMSFVIDSLNIIIGQLEGLDPSADIPEDAVSAVSVSSPLPTVIAAYLPYLHPAIRNASKNLYEHGHTSQAVFEATKALFGHLREKTGLAQDGVELAQLALSEKNPKVVFGDLKDQTVKNRQVGLMDLLTGTFKGVRSPLAHTQSDKLDYQQAFEWLVHTSILCRYIDETKPTTRS